MPSGARLVLSVVGAVLLVGGLGLFLSNFGSGGISMGTAISGMFMFGIGGAMLQFGLRKAMAELAATDTEVAVEHASGAAGRGLGAGLKDAGVLSSQQVIKVRCASCGALDSEDAVYCSACGNRVDGRRTPFKARIPR
jgi:hypothetical protein